MMTTLSITSYQKDEQSLSSKGNVTWGKSCQELPKAFDVHPYLIQQAQGNIIDIHTKVLWVKIPNVKLWH